MSDTSFFRSKGTSSPSTGQNQTAVDATPSEESGPVVAAPAWEKYVTNTVSTDRNQSAVRAEMDEGRRIDRQNAANQRADRAGIAETETWKGSAGKLLRKVGRNPAELLDPEQFADHPTGGAEARRSIWDREVRTARQEARDSSFRLRDPKFQAQSMSDKDREEALATGQFLKESDPEHAKLKGRLAADDDYRATKAELSQKSFDSESRAREIEAMEPDAWFQSRRTAEINANRQPLVEQAQAQKAEAGQAAAKLAEDRAAYDAQMAQGVKGSDLPAMQAKKAAMDAAEAGIAQQDVAGNAGLEKVKQAAVDATKPADDSWDVTRGLKTAVSQLPQLAYGAAGLVGKTAEDLTGFGKGLKEWGLKKYAESDKDMEHLQRDNDSVTTAWGNMTEKGDVGAMVDFAQYAIGYGGGQILESLGVAAIGGAVGAATTGPAAPAGGVAGAVGGIVAKGAAKKVAFGLIEKAIASEAAKIVEKAAIKKGITLTAEELAKQAASSGIRKIAGKSVGSSIALVMNGQMQAMGSIYPEAEKQAALEGRQMDRGDIAKVWLMSAASGTLEGVADKFGVDLLKGNVSGKLAKAGMGRAGSAAVGAVADSVVEGSTEFGQTVLERLGANKSITDAEAQREYVDSAAMGAFIGGGVGGIGGALNPNKAPNTDKPATAEGLEVLRGDVNTAITTIDPTLAGAEANEIKTASSLVNRDAKPSDFADAVLIERDLKSIEEEDNQAVLNADSAVASAKLALVDGTGNPKAVAIAEESRAALQGRTNLVRATLKLASGQSPKSLTKDELKSVGYAKDANGAIDMMDDKDLEAQGLTEALFYPGDDGSIIIHDEAIKRVKAVSPRAFGRVSMSEDEALRKVAERMEEAAKQQISTDGQPNGVRRDSVTGLPASAVVVPLETGGPVEFSVPMQNGPPVLVTAATAEDAERQAAGMFAPGTNMVQVGQSTPTQTPTNEQDKQGQQGGQGQPQAPLPVQQLPAVKGGQAQPSQPTSDVGGATANPAGAGRVIAPTPSERVAKIAAENPEIAKILNVSEDPSVLAAADGEQININPKAVAESLVNAGASEEQAGEYLQAVVGEEVIHVASKRGAKALHGKSPESKAGMTFEKWMDVHYGERIWQGEFTPEMQEQARAAYSSSSLKQRKAWDAMSQEEKSATSSANAGLALWDRMSDANKAFEAIRIMMQANPTEESIALWSKIGKLTKEAIENALAELKKFAATVKGTDQYPLLQAEIKRTEEELKKLYAQEVKPSVKLSGLEELLEQNKKILRPAVFNNLAKKELMASLKGFTFEAESTNENGDLVKHEALVSDSLTQLKTEKTIYEALANCLLK